MISIVLLLFAGGVGFFLYEEASNHVVERFVQSAGRLEASAWYAFLYGASSTHSAQASGSARSIPVLLYHGTPPEGNDNPPLPQEVFVEHMKALKADGWQTVTLDQFTDFMKNGAPLPAKSFLLTFDDARKESFYPVDPVLKDLGYSAVMFVITGFSLPAHSPKASTYYLDQTELQFMARSGRWELESHGDLDHKLYDIPLVSPSGDVTTEQDQHFLSNKLWLEGPGRIETDAEYTARITQDLALAKNKLQDLTGKNVTAFAFPFNDYGQESVNFAGARDDLAHAVESLYTFGFYQANSDKDDSFNYPDPNTAFVKRIEPTANWSGQELVARLDDGAAKSLPYHSGAFPLGEWSSNWGNAKVSNGALSLTASPQTSGAAALLNGSSLWQDYSLAAAVDWQEGDAVSLVGRYRGDSSSFFSCAFTKDRIILQTHQNGEISALKSETYDPADASKFSVSMSMRGSTLSCGAGGVEVSADAPGAFVHAGSAGIQIWGRAQGAESLLVKSVSAQQL